MSQFETRGNPIRQGMPDVHPNPCRVLEKQNSLEQPGMKWSALLISSAVCLGGLSPTLIAAQNVKSVHLMTQWDREVSATNAHPEYPRPTMVRPAWLSLNGLWDFGISFRSQTNFGNCSNQILVPFPVESQLSGAKYRLVAEWRRMCGIGGIFSASLKTGRDRGYYCTSKRWIGRRKCG